jgi:hypothetical protein
MLGKGTKVDEPKTPTLAVKSRQTLQRRTNRRQVFTNNIDVEKIAKEFGE